MRVKYTSFAGLFFVAPAVKNLVREEKNQQQGQKSGY